MKHLAIVLLGLLLASYRQLRTVLGQLDFIRTKAGDGHDDAVVVLTHLLDVIGRPLRPHAVVEHVEEPVKADRRPEKGGKFRASHRHILRKATWTQAAPQRLLRRRFRAKA